MLAPGVALEKVDYEEGTEPSSVVVPAMTIDGKHQINPIAQILQTSKKSKHTPLEILAKSCNVSINKVHGYLVDNTTGSMIKPSQLFEYHGVANAGNIRCPLPDCREPMTYDFILWHFEDHKLSLGQVCDLFKRDFHLWEQHDGSFWYLGDKIAV